MYQQSLSATTVKSYLAVVLQAVPGTNCDWPGVAVLVKMPQLQYVLKGAQRNSEIKQDKTHCSP